MSKIHILTRKQDGAYNAVTHFPAPDGVNVAGVKWADIMPGGEPVAWEDEAEQSDLRSGKLIELALVLPLDIPTEASAKCVTDVGRKADAIAATWLKEFMREYDRYGMKIGKVV